MATFLAVPLKSTNEVDLIKPLQKFITDTYEQQKSEEVTQALSDFHKQRNHVMSKMVDRHESALEVLYKYYDQLCAIESKFPITENQIRISYKWTNSFDKGGLFGGKSLSMYSSAYEKVCILYQIAAVQSQIAKEQNLDSDEGLKTAAKYFQQASGIFNHLKDCAASLVPHPTPDLAVPTLCALSCLMVAQAQDCFFRKARKDRMKEAIIAKIAMQCGDNYQEAFRTLNLESVRGVWPKDWLPHVSGRRHAFVALGQYHQSLVCGANQGYGEQIARLQQANKYMADAKKQGGSSFKFTNEETAVSNALTAAEKDNNYIYHDQVPKPEQLSQVGRAAIAKSLPVTSPMSSEFRDLFEKIVPLAVHHALTNLENRKGEVVNMEIGRLREATQLLNSVLASMNLPAAIEDLSGAQVPASVLEKSVKIRELGGAKTLEKLMQELPELLTRNREILDECVRLLDDEERSDDELRNKFKDRWTRASSKKLTDPIRQEGQKYRGILDAAIQADHVVKEKYAKARNGISILCKNPTELESSIPSASPAAAMKDSPVVQTLRRLMENVDTLKAERDTIENELKDKTFDMSTKFLGALSKDGVIGQEDMSEHELDRVYSPLREQVQDSIRRQEALLGQIQQANMDFSQAKQSSNGAASREAVLKDLAESFDLYCELKGNLEEGTKFYNDLTQLLLRYQNKISDFVFARQTEKEDSMKEIQRAIANQPSEAPPQQPNYQQEQRAKNTAPQRPPPPSIPPAAPPSQPEAGAPPTYGAQGAPPSSQPSQPPYPTPNYPGAPTYQPYPYPAYTPPALPTGYMPFGQPYGNQGYGQGYPPQQPPAQNYTPYGQPGYRPSAPYPQQQWR